MQNLKVIILISIWNLAYSDAEKVYDMVLIFFCTILIKYHEAAYNLLGPGHAIAFGVNLKFDSNDGTYSSY